jgi:dsRNA-specific ribonuclease
MEGADMVAVVVMAVAEEDTVVGDLVEAILGVLVEDTGEDMEVDIVVEEWEDIVGVVLEDTLPDPMDVPIAV